MNSHHNPNQNPATASAVHQVNSNQQACNGNAGGLFPNNRPIVAPGSFMNYLNQPFPLQNTTPQFPMGIAAFNPQQNFNPFPVNQFNPSQQQQQGQFFANNSMNRPVYNQNVGLPNQQVIMQNTIQNIYQLLQLQNSNYPQCPPGNFPMFQNQIPNVMNHQTPGFLPNQQFVMPNFNGPLQHHNQGQQMPNMGQQLQGNPFLPLAPGSVQPQQSQNLLPTPHNLQNQIAPQNHNFLMNGPLQHANQGQQGFVPPLMDVNASRQIVNMGQQQGNSLLPQNPCPTVTNFQEKHGNMPQHKNFTGDKKNDSSYKGFNSQFHHAKHGYNGNMNKEGKNNAAVNSGPRNSNFEKRKVPTLNYTEQEIKQWREARKKHYPTNLCKKEETLSDVTNQESILRRQQLKEILAKQAELGCEVAEIPSNYLSSPQKQNPKIEKFEKERFKKGKFHNKRGTQFNDNRIIKKTRQENQDYQSKNPNNPKERDPSLLQKLLTRDIKRDQNHLLQVFRFMAVNAFFSGDPDESLRFPSVIVREMGVEVAGEPPCSVLEGGEKAVEKVDVVSDEEEGEIFD